MSNLSSNELEQVRLKSNKEIDKISYVYYSDLYADERFKVLNKKNNLNSVYAKAIEFLSRVFDEDDNTVVFIYETLGSVYFFLKSGRIVVVPIKMEKRNESEENSFKGLFRTITGDVTDFWAYEAKFLNFVYDKNKISCVMEKTGVFSKKYKITIGSATNNYVDNRYNTSGSTYSTLTFTYTKPEYEKIIDYVFGTYASKVQSKTQGNDNVTPKVPDAKASSNTDDVYAKLEKYKTMYEKGLIDESEYKNLKATALKDL